MDQGFAIVLGAAIAAVFGVGGAILGAWIGGGSAKDVAKVTERVAQLDRYAEKKLS